MIYLRLSKQFGQLIALAFVERKRPTLELLQLHWFDAPRALR